MSGWQPPQYDPRQHQQRIGAPPPRDQSWQQPGYAQPPYLPPQPRRRRRWPRRHPVLTSLLAAIGLVVGIVVAVSSPPPATPPAAQGGARPPAARAAVKPHTVATFSGNGEQSTAKFTVAATWKLQYSFNCSDFGGQGNFAVIEDGGSDFGGVNVNDLATSKSGSSWAYNDAGTHYLEIDSECNWSVKVIDEG
jgi:hypothetical protein